MSQTVAVILAGGIGSRLGDVRKADLMIGGRRLIERVADRFSAHGLPLLVSTGPQVDWSPLSGVESIPDSDASAGPMSGLLAAARLLASRAETRFLSVAVDTPFLPSDYAPRLLAAAEQGRAAVASWHGQVYPTNAVWRVGDLLAAGDIHPPVCSPQRLLDALDATRIDWSDTSTEDPFASINTMAELLAAQRRDRARAS